jgi:hypothetical protein
LVEAPTQSPNKIAAGSSYRLFGFDRPMIFGYHSVLHSPPPVAVVFVRALRWAAELGSLVVQNSVSMWNCPYCQQQIALTWKRYFTEPGLKHTCPDCGRVSRLSDATSPKLLVLRACGQFLGGVPLALIVLKFGLPFSLVGFVIGGLATGLPIDKYVDGNFRRLLEIEDKTKS